MYPIEIKDAWNPYFVLIESHGTACLSVTKYIHAIDIHTHTQYCSNAYDGPSAISERYSSHSPFVLIFSQPPPYFRFMLLNIVSKYRVSLARFFM